MQISNRRLNILLLLSLFHIATITASNYLVQIPFQFFGMHTTWGAFYLSVCFSGYRSDCKNLRI